MGDLPIRITWDLMALGALSSVLAVFLRGLILKIEDWPRLANNWKLTPSLFGMVGIMLYPEAAPGLSWPVLLCHGLASPAVAYMAYPYIKKFAMVRVQSIIPGAEPPPRRTTEKGRRTMIAFFVILASLVALYYLIPWREDRVGGKREEKRRSSQTLAAVHIPTHLKKKFSIWTMISR